MKFEDGVWPEYDEQLEKLEIRLLLEAVFNRYGHDFRNYSYPSMRRRIWHRATMEQLGTISMLQHLVLHDRDAFERLLGDLVIPVTELFRDPGMFRFFRGKVAPELAKLPFVRIWHAGCASGEEAYSSAIVMDEKGLLDHSRIYATDISRQALQRAREGVVPPDRMEAYERNYEDSGGAQSIAAYYGEAGGVFRLKPSIADRIVFAEHNLVTDRSFNEFHVIFCRNVMIYFNSDLRDRVHALLYESLADGGFLILGGKESVAFTRLAGRYEIWSDEHRVYRKVR
ncbi:CheR family methyltransferase [Cohnella zeiphila]|uniref:Protein-glutamate O-methyltransferase CheR n=1 Tax=Cohnella zeiphila TaxID=2761120 RepID=A0A7X0VVH1_9BACL|nr:protein-glutamate O-methyltransferase CheR [Cohnella zeiphila]MBB6731976.1 protein-glutamate O-methyltransferase CheR [Cohnella zeiphila]